MADAVGSVFIGLGMNTAQFDKQINDASKKLHGFGSDIQRSFSNIGKAGSFKEFSSSISSLVAAFRGAGAAAGAFIAIDVAKAVAGWAAGIAQAAEETENLAQTLGISLKSAVELEGVFRLTIGSAGEARTALLALGSAANDALAGDEAAIDKFRAFGISLEALETTGGDTSKVLDLLADASARFNDGFVKAAAGVDLVGKGWTKLASQLAGGKAELDELKKKFNELDPAAEKATTAGGRLDKQLDTLGVSITGVGNIILEKFEPQISAAIQNMTDFVNWVGRMIEKADAALKPLGGFANTVKHVADQLIQAVNPLYRTYVILKAIKDILPELNVPTGPTFAPGSTGTGTPKNPRKPQPPGGPLPDDAVLADPRDVPTVLPKEDMVPTWKGDKDFSGGADAKGGGGGGGKSSTLVADLEADLELMIIRRKKYFEDTTQLERDYWAEHLSLAADGSEESQKIMQKLYDLDKKLAEQKRDDAIANAEADARVSDAQFQREKQRIDHLRDIEMLSGTEALDAHRELIDRKWALDQQYYEKKRAAAEGDTKKLKELAQQQRVDYITHLTEQERIAQEKTRATWDRLRDGVRDFTSVLESSFSNIFDSIVDGTFKLKNALGSLMRDFGKMLASRAFKLLIEGPEGGGGIGGIFTKLLGSVFKISLPGASASTATGIGGWSWGELNAELPANAQGGLYRVAGAGGIDSQTVAFRATPGEMVDVYHEGRGGHRAGETITINLNPSEGWVAGVADQRIITASGQIINVAVVESQKRVARNFGPMSTEASRRQL